jgi:glycosyltransferase involved in cell wall biosynthesis
MARRLRDIADIPIVFTYHTKFDVDISNAINGELMRRAAIRLLVENIKACDEIWVVSRGAGENLKNLGYSGDYLIMENGVDFPKGGARPEEVEKLRREYGLEAGTTVFLFVGRLMWYKGLKLIIDGLASLKERKSMPFKMFFVGEGADGEEAAAYAERRSLGGEAYSPAPCATGKSSGPGIRWPTRCFSHPPLIPTGWL